VAIISSVPDFVSYGVPVAFDLDSQQKLEVVTVLRDLQH